MTKWPGGTVEQAGASAPEKERRYIYNGTPATSGAPAAGAYAIRSNRRAVRRKVSTFNLILLLFGIGGAVVLYVNNIITINRLSSEINERQERYERLVNVNAALRADVNTKSTWERISTVASEQLRLRPAKSQPVWFSIDWDRAKELGALSPRVK